MKKSLIFLISFFAIIMMAIPQPNEHWYYPKPGDGTWRLSKRYYGTPDSSEFIAKINNLALKNGPNPNWRYYDVKLGIPVLIPNTGTPEFKPQTEPIRPSIQVATPEPFTWWENRTGPELFLGLAALCLLILLIVIINKYINALLQEKEFRGKWLDSASKVLLLEEENENLRNKLPIEAPEIVTSDWLRDNNPVGNPIPLPNVDDSLQPTINAIEVVAGKKPDFIAFARVSTVPNGTKMKFSHEREAVTGLENVNVFLGWDWDNENGCWKEVGMWAGSCANGFEANPDKIKKGEIFSKIELVNGQNPVIFVNNKDIPMSIQYPKTIWPLVLKHHDRGINEIRRAGAVVEILKNPTTKN